MSKYAYAPINFIHVLILPCSYKKGAQKKGGSEKIISYSQNGVYRFVYRSPFESHLFLNDSMVHLTGMYNNAVRKGSL